MTRDEIKAYVLARHDQIVQLARQRFPMYAKYEAPTVYFFENGRTAGIAHYNGRIGYNVHMFAQAGATFINDTIAHEIAHHVCFMLGIDNGHGRNWKRVCVMLGGDGKRCFMNDGTIKPKMLRHRKRYEYKTDCGTVIMLSDVIHGKIQRGEHRHLKSNRSPIRAHHFTGREV